MKYAIYLLLGMSAWGQTVESQLSHNGAPACTKQTEHGFIEIPCPSQDQPATGKVPIKQSFHHCAIVRWSANSPHLFDVAEVYHCDEGDIEIAGQWKMAIEYKSVFETKLGRPEGTPRRATSEDYKNYKWCSADNPRQLGLCGDKPTICFDGKPGTWDPAWLGYSCATTDHTASKPALKKKGYQHVTGNLWAAPKQ